MPRGGKRGGGRGRGRGGSRGGGGARQNQFQDNRVSFDKIDKSNEKFERFYNTISIVPEGPEREAFWTALRKELPNSWRFTGSKGHALGVRDNLVNRFFPVLKDIKHEGRPVELPQPIAWYPNGLAYSMTTPKNVVRKYEPFKDFQRFLVSETGVGNISRQEEVSMIPPLLLDVQPHHTVLDLCAAPGSKSAQLVELLHAGEEDRVARAIEKAKTGGSGEVNGEAGEDCGRSTGILVANDVNYQRAQMLVHQVKRLNSPNLIVTNHDATLFPSIALPAVEDATGKKTGKWLKFDRILADVPCSGDGTCRKNPGIWKDWTPQNGLGLYITQVRILTRALQMLKVGGRVVYSTCSLNPVENEAVIASAIERCGGASKIRLVDSSDRLPDLKRTPGLKDWSIMNRSGTIYESWAEAAGFEQEGSKIVPGMFPPEAEENIPLENCWRVYPHQQNTGGFFIAALEKLSEVRAKPEDESKSQNRDWAFVTDAIPEKTAFTETIAEIEKGGLDEPKRMDDVPTVTGAPLQNSSTGDLTDAPTVAGAKRAAPDEDAHASPSKKQRVGDAAAAPDVAMTEAGQEAGVTSAVKDATKEAPFEESIPVESAQPNRRRHNDANEEAFKYLDSEHPELVGIYKFYDLHSAFPRDRFLVRNPAGDPVKGIYYTAQLIKELLISNENRGMKFVHAGVKMFMKQDAQGQDICRWRIQTEGLPIIEGWVGESRVVRLQKRSTLRKLLVEMFPKVATDKHEDGTETGGWKDLGEIGEAVNNLGGGCCVLRVDPTPNAGDDEFKESLTLPLWRSKASVNLMLPKEDRRAMLLRIYNEDVELINHSDPKQNGSSNKEITQQAKPDHQPKGSIPTPAESAELKERIKNADNEVDTTINGVPAEQATALPATDLGAVALEEEAVAAKDQIETQRLEVLEDEERKIAEAMPERAGDEVGDDYNKTV
ncbi:Putative SAM-dependent methyltransferase RsmB/NOP2-type, RNA (C5-cytosine) methyltransferase [Septoria linicola]|uniref:SAM-dependent methyltransferase RsmB/NOP2-type, RNA (C5-cytosine) methyltransferase n=1 Tax=Septoria linicola TaxID=215465 RepID=A0A9Q9AGA3_9PEZI|nr:Putative SAM-dependent methyltransferase RsmB/NOP2-type, RNA (C5-cytosine) methyltransferase [Septoria linicola]